MGVRWARRISSLLNPAIEEACTVGLWKCPNRTYIAVHRDAQRTLTGRREDTKAKAGYARRPPHPNALSAAHDPIHRIGEAVLTRPTQPNPTRLLEPNRARAPVP